MEEKPSKVVYTNDGQTKVTLIGKWFTMTPEQIEQDYQTRLEAGDPQMVRINDKLCEISQALARRALNEVAVSTE